MDDLPTTANDPILELEEPKESSKKEAQPVALNATMPVKLDPLDFVTSQRNFVSVREAQLRVQMYERELMRAQEDLNRLGHAHMQHLTQLAAKHNVDLDAMMISEDGYFIPRPQPQASRR